MSDIPDPINNPLPGDFENTLLRKVLQRMITVIDSIKTVTPLVQIEPGNVNIGSVTIKDQDGAIFADVESTPLVGTEAGLVVRSIPSGTQTVAGAVSVSNLPVTQPVSGTVAVSNLPVTQPVSGTVAVSNFPATEIEDPLWDASRTGQISGKTAVAYHIPGRRAGFNSTSVSQDAAEFLATSIDQLPELTGAESLEVVSSSANDTSAGTGARTVRVVYLDTSDNLQTSADITLNGVTPVAVAWKANFILWMTVTTAGSTGAAVGNILLRIAGAGATQEQITAGANRSLSSRFKVPAGYTGYIQYWQVSAIGSANQDTRLKATTFPSDRTLSPVYITRDTGYAAGGTEISNLVPWLKFPEHTRIKVSTIPSAAAAANRLDADVTVLIVAN